MDWYLFRVFQIGICGAVPRTPIADARLVTDMSRHRFERSMSCGPFLATPLYFTTFFEAIDSSLKKLRQLRKRRLFALESMAQKVVSYKNAETEM